MNKRTIIIFAMLCGTSAVANEPVTRELLGHTEDGRFVAYRETLQTRSEQGVWTAKVVVVIDTVTKAETRYRISLVAEDDRSLEAAKRAYAGVPNSLRLRSWLARHPLVESRTAIASADRVNGATSQPSVAAP